METNHDQSVPQYVAILGNNQLPVGGGCLVEYRRIVTCAHVVEAALGVRLGSIRESPTEKINVHFPFAKPTRFFAQCRVLLWNPVDESYPRDENEDLALLEILSNDTDSIEPIEVGRPLYGNRVFCYKAGPNGGHASGIILTTAVEGGRIQINRSEADGIQFEEGFSGAPLFTADLNRLFCGILMTGRSNLADRTAFGKSPTFIRALIDRDATARGERPLNSQEAAAYVAENRRANVRTSNPYLLGRHFYGRRRELAKLTEWICGENDELRDVRIFCIRNLGGTGKSALVHHWLNLPTTASDLRKSGLPAPFWASFYSKNFSFPEMLDRLKDYVGISLDRSFVGQGNDAYRRLVVREVLNALKREPMLLIFDGLEREMGAFSDSVNRGLDSEEQDVRAESGKVPATERCLREVVFQDLLVGLSDTKAKVILTTRHTPEELYDAPRADSRVHIHELGPLEPDDACSIWIEAVGNGKGSVDEFVFSFFDFIGYHPHAIIIVATALASSQNTNSLKEWFKQFDTTKQLLCTDRDALKTTLRHRWIDLATHDLKHKRRKVWLLLLEIAHHAGAVQISTLRDIVTRSAVDVDKKRILFESDDLFDDALAHLEILRLVGISDTRQTVDIHPIIRTNVRQWAFGVLRNPATADTETLRAVHGDGDGELTQKFFASTIEQQFKTLQAADPEERDLLVGGQSMLRQKLAEMYQEGGDRARPWMRRLPRFSLRRVQADCVYLTANALMANGDWDDSRYLFRVAMILYELCGDTASVGDCMWSMNWQLIYGGNLFESERTVLQRLHAQDPKNLRGDKNLFWLALLLGVRQHELTPLLLASIDRDLDRWTLQAASESEYYREKYKASHDLVLKAIRRDERIGRRQELWEWISLGLSEMRTRSFENALESLGRARSAGIGLGYEIITLFAFSGLVEALFEASAAEANSHSSAEFLNRGITVHNQYRALDQTDRYQIPATDAHLAAAKIYEAINQRNKAITWGRRALQISRRNGKPFVYASGERRALDFLQSIDPSYVHEDVRYSLNAVELRQHERSISTIIDLVKGSDHAN